MTECINRKTAVSAEELLRTEITVNQALIDLLIAKQVISEEELVAGIRKIEQEQAKMINESKKIVSLLGKK